ncbi:hypothetical protein [Paenibacillus macerans]|uniref:hypothetical protein n=1 Tax=Paenibacillus macerans TaxID=44252 RepID=UPI00203D6796|nr:hypothetical protein [Paenibacillus macerans]MCM3701477.1 hypothetical protein [Paenibacillus macerans]
MTWNTTTSRWERADPWSLVTDDWLHPDEEDTVLKWVAPFTGTIRITGNVSKHPANQDGDGVRVKIMKNNQQVWPCSGWHLSTIASNFLIPHLKQNPLAHPSKTARL